jgi:hypothetical protein
VRTIAALAALLAAIPLTHLLSVWMADEISTLSPTFGAATTTSLFVLLPVAILGLIGGLGWLVLRWVRPNVVVALGYLAVGGVVLGWIPVLGATGPDWFPVFELFRAPAYAVWLSAGAFIVGVAGLWRLARGA